MYDAILPSVDETLLNKNKPLLPLTPEHGKHFAIHEWRGVGGWGIDHPMGEGESCHVIQPSFNPHSTLIQPYGRR